MANQAGRGGSPEHSSAPPGNPRVASIVLGNALNADSALQEHIRRQHSAHRRRTSMRLGLSKSEKTSVDNADKISNGEERTLEERWVEGEISAAEYQRLVVQEEKNQRERDQVEDSLTIDGTYTTERSVTRQSTKVINNADSEVETTFETSASLVKTMAPLVVLVLSAAAIALITTVLSLGNSLLLGRDLITTQRIRLSSVSATAASWTALSVAHSLRSAHMSDMALCNETAQLHQLNASFGNGVVKSFYIYSTRNSTTQTCGWSEYSSSFFPHNLNKLEAYDRISKIVSSSSQIGSPWVFARSIEASSSSEKMLLFYVLPIPKHDLGFAIAAVDFSVQMTSAALSHDQAHNVSQLITGPLGLSVKQGPYSRGITEQHPGTKLQEFANEAAISCTNHGDIDVLRINSTAEYTTKCSRIDSNETKILPEKLVVGVSVSQSSFYQAQQTMIFLSVTIACSGLGLILFSQLLILSGSLSVDDSISLAALIAALVTFLTLTSCVSLTDNNLQEVVSDIGHLQARALDENIQHNMGKYTYAVDYLKRTLERNLMKHKFQETKSYYSSEALLDLVEIAMQDVTTPVDMVYIGEESTGNFYGITTYNDASTDYTSYIYTNPVQFGRYNQSTKNDSYRTSSYAVGGEDGRTILREQGRVGPQTIDPYDPRVRPWYKKAVDWRKSGNTTAIWSPVYTFFSQAQLGITLAQAFCNENGTVVGVIGVDFTLGNIGKLLESRVQELGEYNESTILWMSEGSPQGLVVGVGGGGGANKVSSLAAKSLAEVRFTADRLGGKFQEAYKALKTENSGEFRKDSGVGVGKRQIETRQLARMAVRSAGLDWWLVQSVSFRSFIEGVYAQGSSALMYGLIIASVSATLTILVGNQNYFRKLLHNNQEVGVTEKQRRSIALAAKMRRTTIQISKKKSESQLLEMIYLLLVRANREYPRLHEYWSVEMLSNAHFMDNNTWDAKCVRAYLHGHFTGDPDSMWMWMLFGNHFAHMSLSFWDAPNISARHLESVLFLQGVCIIVEIIDMAIRVYILLPAITSEETGTIDAEGKKGRTRCRWRLELDVPSLRVSIETIRLRGAIRIFCVSLLFVEWCYRLFSWGTYTTCWTAPLRALIVVSVWDEPRDAFSAFVSTVWAARHIFLLGLQFLLVVIVIMISVLQDAYKTDKSEEVGRALASPESSFLTMFIYTFFGAGYEDITYDHRQEAVVPYAILFLVIILTGVFLFLAVLLSIFQSEFTNTVAKTQDDRRHERMDGHQLVFLLMVRLEALRDEKYTRTLRSSCNNEYTSTLARQLSRAASRVSQMANFELAHKIDPSANSSFSDGKLSELRENFSHQLRIRKETMHEILTLMPGASFEHIKEAISGVLNGDENADLSKEYPDDTVSADRGSTDDYLIDMDEFHAVVENFRRIVGSFRTSGTSVCRTWSATSCINQSYRKCKRVGPSKIKPSTDDVPHTQDSSNVSGSVGMEGNRSVHCHDLQTPLCCCCWSLACQKSTTASAKRIFLSDHFGNYRLVLVLSNVWAVCFLATETGRRDPNLHMLFTSVFITLHSAEILLHVVLQGPSFFSSLTRQTDIVIVLVSVFIFFSLYLPEYIVQGATGTPILLNGSSLESGDDHSNTDLKYVPGTPERLAIALPCLRLFTVVKSTRRLSFGLLSMFPKFYDLALLLLLTLYFFAAIGTPLFGGRLKAFADKGDIHADSNFDTFGATIRTLFYLLLENGESIMYASIDSYGSLWVSVYFVSFALVCSLIFTNLVIGVICELFMTEIYSILQLQIKNTTPTGLSNEQLLDNPSLNSQKEKDNHAECEDGKQNSRVKELEEANLMLLRENEKLVSALNRSRLRAVVPSILKERSLYRRRGSGGSPRNKENYERV